MNDTSHAPVVVGVDGSDSSRSALELAARQAELTAVPLSIVMTWNWPANYGSTMVLATDYDPQGDADQLLEELVTRVRAAHPGLQVNGRSVHGEAREVLVDRSRDASMLVVGSRGHGELTGMLLGSVSSYCVTHAHCPTLVVRH